MFEKVTERQMTFHCIFCVYPSANSRQALFLRDVIFQMKSMRLVILTRNLEFVDRITRCSNQNGWQSKTKNHCHPPSCNNILKPSVSNNVHRIGIAPMIASGWDTVTWSRMRTGNCLPFGQTPKRQGATVLADREPEQVQVQVQSAMKFAMLITRQAVI